jgi:3-deoxy-D-manno-octulosonic-acid transferase
MRALYTLLVALALPFASLGVAWRSLSDPAYRKGWGQRFGGGARLGGTQRSFWVHAVSVGEVQAASPLLRALHERWPEAGIVVTSATPAGRSTAQDLFASWQGARAGGIASRPDPNAPPREARYAPYDFPAFVRGALARYRPAMLLVVETELWPNLLAECRRAGVPVLLVSARLSARSHVRLARFASLLRGPLRTGVTVAAQTQEDAARFISLGVPEARVVVAGNLKFDRTPAETLRERGIELRRKLAPGGRFVWVAGSTHQGEEPAALWAHSRLVRERGDALLVIAPRHKPRFNDVWQMLGHSGFRVARYSDWQAGKGNDPATCQVLLIDTIGDLEACYAAADLAFVGGSLVAAGGHSLLEPAALGVAVVTGTGQGSAPEVAQLLSQQGAVKLVANSAELADEVLRLAGEPQARARMGATGSGVVAANRGALARAVALVSELLG